MNSIEVKNLSKDYKVYNSPLERLKEAIHPFKKVYHKSFYALKDASFSIEAGQTVGIIGKNGSGKSTLLKIITGVLPIYEGSLMVKGKISALLELGAGFNPKLTGLENIYLSGTISGKSKVDVDQIVDEIISFADIGDFINQPVSTYSSGMFARLAFAVSIHSNPDILIIDEALSVGDMAFQNKCFAKIDEFVSSKDKTVLFVSHSLSAIRLLCKKVIWINEGKIIDIGDTQTVTDKYERFMSKSKLEDKKHNTQVVKDIDKSFIKGEKADNTECFFNDIKLFSIDKETYEFYTNDNLSIVFDIYNSTVDVLDISIGIAIHRSDGLEIVRINNTRDDFSLKVEPGDNKIKFDIQSLNLLDGKYFFSFFLSKTNLAQTYHKIENDIFINVKTPYAKCGWRRYDGVISIPHHWEKF